MFLQQNLMSNDVDQVNFYLYVGSILPRQNFFFEKKDESIFPNHQTCYKQCFPQQACTRIEKLKK